MTRSRCQKLAIAVGTLTLCACSGEGQGTWPGSETPELEEPTDAQSSESLTDSESDDDDAPMEDALAVPDAEPTSERDDAPPDNTETTTVEESDPFSEVTQEADTPSEADAPSEAEAALAEVVKGASADKQPTDNEDSLPELTPDSAEVTDPVAGLSPRELIEQTVFRIEATGTFATPLSADMTSIASGTGFVIDDGGYALTNAHVVSGATLLRVAFPNEDRDRNAQVIARAECSDLALLKLEGNAGDFAYLDWSGETADLGTDVLAVGYPLGGDITLTSGIVSKGSTEAHTTWASVDDVIEHTAIINPGSSGGPLLSDDYEVLGINYAATSLNQYYAISEREIGGIVEQLLAGNDVYSIGLTGTAVGDEDISGIWVYAVQAGSAADSAGIEPGDLITHFGNLPLVPNAAGLMTMEDYCDILRTHAEGAAIDVRLLRWSSGETLEGQINGRELAVVARVDDPPAETAPDSSGLAVHSSGSLSVEAPPLWTQVGSYSHTRYDDADGHALVAAPDEEAFNTRFDVPGLMLVAWSDEGASPDVILDNYSFADVCETTTERAATSLGRYQGVYEIYSGCPGDGSVITQMALIASDHTLHLTYQAVTDADIDAFGRTLDTMGVQASLLP